MPEAPKMRALANDIRTWRDVVMDVAAGAPDVQIFISTYEQHGAAPERLLSYLLGQHMPAPNKQIWCNKRPSAQELLRLPLGIAELQRVSEQISGIRWDPFTAVQKAQMQERYADDLFWLRAGADGLAHLLEDPKSEMTGYPTELDFANKGQSYDARQRMARPR